ncbi:uncharacterized protein N7518_007570 [Penicillium psychrosexuale]|uniref:uncharacterized protein n=1 Tax=Penicillium psychrosexuale TaxID=1002107 RepID=UPI002544EDBE|nr:uncharacterized protein N7518_007570 [Penicillium psychrosexuale]KAJ5790559.1 hypothetical protein N7518_007570 [Penicillium psychrosexuale]
MSGYPTSTAPIRVIGFRETCKVDGPNAPVPSPKYISLVHQAQNDGEPLHWSLFIARENQYGLVYQVKGDAEHMRYLPSPKHVNIVHSVSFLNIYHLASVTEEQEELVRQVAEQEPPPQAANRQSVTENSQGWTVRIITKLVEMGIVPTAKLEMARSMVEPI